MAICVALALSACGDEGSSQEASSPPRETTQATAATPTTPPSKPKCGPQPKSIASNEIGEPGPEEFPKPDIRPPCGPPPKKLVVIDLKEGSGRPAAPGDEVIARFVGADYETGEETYGSWFSDGIGLELGSREQMLGLEIGFRGMQAGGRRQLIVPPKLSEGHDTVIYIVDLLKINRG